MVCERLSILCIGNVMTYHQSCTISMTRNDTEFMILALTVLVQVSVQEILSCTASGHVMVILNYPAQGMVQDLCMIEPVPVLVQVGTGKCRGNRVLYCIRTCHENP